MTTREAAAAAATAPTRRLRSAVSLSYPDVPVWQVLRGAKSRWPQQVALDDGAQSLTWQALWEQASVGAARLAGAGLRPGQVLALQLHNGLDMAVAYWAGQLTGLTISPVNPLQPTVSIEHQLADAGAAAVVAEVDGALVLTGRTTEVASGPWAGLPAAGTFAPYTAPDLARAIAHISYTGGTTGSPKGVVVTQRSLVANALQFANWASSAVPVRSTDDGLVVEQPGSSDEWPVRLGEGVVVAGAPWFHAMGLGGGVVVPALLGNRSLLLGRFDPTRFLDATERERITSVSGAPAMLSALVREQETTPRDVSSVRLISCGGGPLPPTLADRLAAGFPRAVVTQAYGLTEVTMAAVGLPTSRLAPRATGSVGLPMADTEVLLLDDPEQDGPGGEILLRGPQVMLGYRGRPEATAEVLRDGWLRTGDLGVIDEHGYLKVVDRSKDMLIFKGYNVYPSELEALLRQQPGVRDAAVVGLADPDDGDHPVAFVVAEDPESWDAAALADAVNGQVVHYKRLRAVHLVDALPVSALGKVLKNRLRAEAGRRHRLDRLNSHSGELVQKMGIRYIEVTAPSDDEPARLVATMPVGGNRQGYELLHGGASVVLAETVGSALAVVATDFTRRAVGLEINATHHRSALSGLVTATGTVLSIGRTAATLEIVVTDEEGRRCCTCRLTCLLRDRPST